MISVNRVDSTNDGREKLENTLPCHLCSWKSILKTTARMIEEQAYKLKESINELRETERTYIDRLDTILDVFRLRLRVYLDDDMDSLIFGSIEALIKCNEAFLKELDEDDHVSPLLHHVNDIHQCMIYLLCSSCLDLKCPTRSIATDMYKPSMQYP
jgi:guanine nucleotide exchange factor for Rho/Rac/Cdc42-like GTPase family protein